MKRQMKILALVLSGLMIFAMLAGCGASHKDWEEIGPKGEMIIGVTPNAPMNYQDENGEYTLGFDTEFAEAVCAILEVKAKFVEIDWEAKETELNSKNIDAIWNGMTITDERAKSMDISVAYMTNRPVIVVRAADLDKYQSAGDFAGVALVAEAGSTLEECVNEQAIFANADYTPVDAQLKGLMEVLAGTADMTVIDGTMAGEQTKEGSDFAALAIIDKNFPSEEYGIAFRKKSPDTLKKVNDAIKQLKDDGTLQAIADKYGLGLLLIK